MAEKELTSGDPKARAGEALAGLLAIMERLRAPDGCAWDRAQDLGSLRPYLVEESYEVLDALDAVVAAGTQLAAGRGPPAAPAPDAFGELRAELGDLLFQIVFQSRLAEEQGAFGMAEVIDGIAAKLTRRHPHVFVPAGNVLVPAGARPGERPDAAAVASESWAELKRKERLGTGATLPSALDGIPTQAPALLRAERMGEKAAREGFDWPTVDGVRRKLREELDELDAAIASGNRAETQAELGDVLFTLCNLARWLQTPAEDALRGSLGRFEARFRHVEQALAARGLRIAQVDPTEADRLWTEAKRALARF